MHKMLFTLFILHVQPLQTFEPFFDISLGLPELKQVCISNLRAIILYFILYLAWGV